MLRADQGDVSLGVVSALRRTSWEAAGDQCPGFVHRRDGTAILGVSCIKLGLRNGAIFHEFTLAIQIHLGEITTRLGSLEHLSTRSLRSRNERAQWYANHIFLLQR